MSSELATIERRESNRFDRTSRLNEPVAEHLTIPAIARDEQELCTTKGREQPLCCRGFVAGMGVGLGFDCADSMSSSYNLYTVTIADDSV